MREARVRLTWEPSVSSDVVQQDLVVDVAGVEMYNEQLSSEAGTFEFIIPELANVLIKLRADDGFFQSNWATLEFVLPDLDEPLSPTNLGIEIIEVLEADIEDDDDFDDEDAPEAEVDEDTAENLGIEDDPEVPEMVEG